MFASLRQFLGLNRKALTAGDLPWLASAVPTASGMAIGVEGALRVPAVSAAVRVLSEAAMTLPAKVVRRVDGADVDAPEHPVARLVDEGVNEWTAWPEFVRDLVAAALCHDEGGLAWCNRIAGEVREIIVYRRGVVSVDYSADTQEPTYRLGGQVLPLGDVVHLRSPFGRAPLSLCREAIGVAATMEQHAARLFGNAGRPSGTLKAPGKLSAEVAARISKSWHEATSGINSGRTAVLEEGMEFQSLALNSVDAQFLELRTFQINEIARAFRVPPGMLYEMSRQTWSNMEQASREFLVYSLEPWLLSLEGALNRALFLPEERRTHRVRFDRDDLTRADLSVRAAAINSLIASQVLNPDEGRDWLGLGPRPDGEGGRFFNPNISPAPAASTTEAPDAAA